MDGSSMGLEKAGQPQLLSNLSVEEIRYADAYPMFYSNTNFRVTTSVEGISILISMMVGSAKSTMSIPLNCADKHSSFVL